MTKRFMEALFAEGPRFPSTFGHLTGASIFDTLFIEAGQVVQQIYRVLPKEGTKVLYRFPDLRSVAPSLEGRSENFMIMFSVQAVGYLGKGITEFGVQINALEPGGETEQFFSLTSLPGIPIGRCYSAIIFTHRNDGIGVGDEMAVIALGVQGNLLSYEVIRPMDGDDQVPIFNRDPMVLSLGETQCLSYTYYALASLQTVNLHSAVIKKTEPNFWEIVPR